MYSLEKETEAVISAHSRLAASKIEFCVALYKYKTELEKQDKELKLGSSGKKGSGYKKSSMILNWKNLCESIDLSKSSANKYVLVGAFVTNCDPDANLLQMNYSALVELTSLKTG